MSKHTDDNIEIATKPVVASDPPEPRMHRIPGRVTKDELRIIRRAVCRYLADLASLEDETDELTGRTIAAISRAWLKAQADHQNGKT
jgi:hypothetical protein